MRNKLENVNSQRPEHYGTLPHKAGKCIACGACEIRRLLEVKIFENMRQAEKIFGE